VCEIPLSFTAAPAQPGHHTRSRPTIYYSLAYPNDNNNNNNNNNNNIDVYTSKKYFFQPVGWPKLQSYPI
jgi:hypothetical protein